MTVGRSEKMGTPVSSGAREIRSTSHRMSTFLRFGLCCARLLEHGGQYRSIWGYKEAEDAPNTGWQLFFFRGVFMSGMLRAWYALLKRNTEADIGCTCFSSRLPCQISQG